MQLHHRLTTSILALTLVTGAGVFAWASEDVGIRVALPSNTSLTVADAIAAGSAVSIGSPHATANATAAATSAVLPKATHRITGWLHTQGSLILDSRGRRVRFVSMGIHGMEVGAGLSAAAAGRSPAKGWSVPTPATYANVARWGFNSVRLAVSWANLEPAAPTVVGGRLRHHFNAGYVAALDGIVRGFARRHVAVILDMHQNDWSPAFARGSTRWLGAGLPAWLYPGVSSEDTARRWFFADHGRVQQRLAAAWRFLAGHFAHDRMVVGADLFNEPYALRDGSLPASKLHLDALYRRLGTAVRAANPRMLLIFEDSQDLGHGGFGLSSAAPFRNEVYSFHDYRPTWSSAWSVIRRYEARARRWNVPLWIGEFNGFGAGVNAQPVAAGWQSALRRMMRVTRRAGIGWSFWAYDGANSLVYLHSDTPKQPLLSILRSGR